MLHLCLGPVNACQRRGERSKLAGIETFNQVREEGSMTETTRRRLLQASGGLAAAGLASGIALAQEIPAVTRNRTLIVGAWVG
jgi:hypothetical protein